MSETLKQVMDRANPNTLPDQMRTIKLGQTLGSDVKQTLRKQSADAAGADPYNLATLDVLKMPDEAKAMTILRAFARAGTAGTGEMAVVAPNTTPASGQLAVTPSGDIALLGADAITDVDVEYLPARGDVMEVTGQVAANVLTIPASLTARGVVMAIEVEALTGGSVGDKIILAPGAGAPAAGQARLNIAKSTITFAGADAVTRARVRLVVSAEVDLKASLEAASTLV